jgi:hypothetical protein
MSSVTTIARKLRAWDEGRPLPRYDTIHHAVVPADQALVVSFVRMAGESRPWGIAWGLVGTEPKIRSVPDGRVRDDVGVLCADFAEDLLEHMRVHNFTYDPAPEPQHANPDEIRQVWLPNGQHIAMLHHLSYTYSQTKFGGANQEILRALGRLSGWMFRDVSRAGSQHVVSASGLLDENFVFPAQDTRTAHLGFQLAWIATSGDREARMQAATEAETKPVSPTLDPVLDRDRIADLVDAWQGGRRDGTDVSGQADEIEEILADELRRRWELAERAYRVIEADERPVNAGVAELLKRAQGEFYYQHQRIELRHADPSRGPAFIAHPETDFHGSAAASRYLVYAAADEAYANALVHADDALFAETITDGRAFIAHVDEVWTVAIRSASGRGSPTRKPHWKLRLDPSLPHRLRESARITPRGSPGHEATVIELDADANDLYVTIEWTKRKTMALNHDLAAKPDDGVWEGENVAFVQSDASSLTDQRSQRVWKVKDGPGAWLTHGPVSPPIEITADDAGDVDLVIDDVAQIEDGEEP